MKSHLCRSLSESASSHLSLLLLIPRNSLLTLLHFSLLVYLSRGAWGQGCPAAPCDGRMVLPLLPDHEKTWFIEMLLSLLLVEVKRPQLAQAKGEAEHN